MLTGQKHYLAALCERVNFRTQAREWVWWFRHSDAPKNSKPAWFDIEEGKHWWDDPRGYLWFCSMMAHQKTVAVKFARLEDAISFSRVLRAAEIECGEHVSESAA